MKLQRMILSSLALFFTFQLFAGYTFAQNKEACVASDFKKPKDSDLVKKLTPLEYSVTQKDETEQPFKNAYWNHHEAGIYVDVVSGEPLFSSKDKFDSGTGWPSFTKPIDKAMVVEKVDYKLLGLPRTEVRSKNANSHLGHVFTDGPGETGLRYCINSAALKFIPVAKLKESGYENYLVLFGEKPMDEKQTNKLDKAPKKETAILAGGCFWGMEEIIRKIPGVLETNVGYTGGHTLNPTYTDVKTGITGHAEAISVVFDPEKLSYKDLLGYFFRMHDPTTKNRQENDIGTQYRSAIFYLNPEQKDIAEAVKIKVDSSGKWKKPIVTEITKAEKFYPAEDYHQDYLEKNPGGYTCHWLRD